MQLILDTNGLTIKKRNNSFWVIGKKQHRLISPHRLTSIAVTQDCNLTTSAIRLAIEHQIPILIFNAHGKPQGRLWSTQFSNIATLRRKQALFPLRADCTNWVIDLFKHKAQQQEGHLRFLRDRRPRLVEDIAHLQVAKNQFINQLIEYEGKKLSEVRNTLLGKEGTFSRKYWQLLAKALPDNWHFPSRTRRPAQDPFNAAINYGYGMTYSIVEGAILAAGLDPQMGCFHVDTYQKPTLAFDLIEPFRPWIDQFVTGQIYSGKLRIDFFDHKQKGIFLNKSGKAHFIPAYHHYMNSKSLFLEKVHRRKSHIYRFCGQLAKVISKQKLEL